MKMNKLQELIDEVKKESFIKGYKATNEEAFGILISHYAEYDGIEILRTASYALENSNFHKEKEKVDMLVEDIRDNFKK
jgi:hypothetical protein